MKKRFLSILLTAVLLLCAVPLGLGLVDTAYAAETANSGTCGDNVTWRLSDDGVLTISGTGEMSGYGVSYTYEDVVVSTYTPWEAYRSSIKSIVIKDGVTSIGGGVFAGCGNLTSVAIPSSVTSIGWCAFLSCSSLKSVHVPSGTTTIDARAFSNCTGLTDVTIPGSVTSINNSAFSKCSSLTSVTIPDGVTSIGDSAFAGCTSLTDVTIPSSVTWIDSAFSDCSSLTDVYYGGYGMDWLEVYGHDQIPDSVTVHYKEDLYGRGSCGENVEWVMTLDGTLTISGTGAMQDYNYYNNCVPWNSVCLQVKSVVIERGVSSIGEYAFSDCSSLTSVTIPSSVTSIGDGAFKHCDALTSVKISDSVTSIGYDAFYGCDALTDVYYGGYGVDWLKASGYNTVVPSKTTVHFKDDLYDKGTCGVNANWVMTADGTLTISGKGRISNYDYDYSNYAPWDACGKYIKSIVIKSGVTGIGDWAFHGCSALTSVTIPNTVTAIGDEAFRNCKALTSVTIPNSVTAIGDGAFSYCEALTGMTIPGSVKTISGRAFSDCTSLRSVTIPNGVTAIDESLFYGCTSLTSVTIPSSVTSIGWGAFFRCSSLKSVNIPGSVTSIDGSAFSECTSLTSVTIPNSVTAIYGGAFSGCTSLTDVTLPKSLTRLGGEVFRDCTSLTGMTVPEGVDCIYGSTFANCTSLTSVTLPSTVNWIGDNAFFNCVRLTSVTIPKRVCYIYQDAFRSCDSLADVYYGGTTADWAKIVMEDGNGDLTNATLHCTAPAAPAAPVVTAGNSAVSGKPMLTWNAVEGATSYKVYRAAKEDGTYGLLGSTSATSYTNTGAKEGVTYYYKVTAVNDIGESEPSNIVSGQVKTVTPKPAAPVVSIGHSAASGKPVLTWSAVEGATSYRIYRSTAKGSGYSLLGTTTATSYTNTGAKAGTTYYYRVKACNDAGWSPYSNIVSGQAKSVTPKPSAPVVKIGHSASSGKPMLTWNAVSGATSYKVYRATSQNGTYSLLGTVTATSYTNTGAKAGTTYWYKVKAVNSAGESAYSNVVSGRATVTTLTLGHSSTSGKPQLTWKAVSGAASYKVYRATAKNGAYSVINTTKALTYTNTGAALGTTYYYKVEALNAAGKSMGFSAVVEGKVAPVLAVGYSSVSGKPQLTWKAVPGATEYQVYRSTQQNSGYSKINTTTSTSYVNTGAKANTMYYYRIVAVKGTAVSDFSNIVSARPSK